MPTWGQQSVFSPPSGFGCGMLLWLIQRGVIAGETTGDIRAFFFVPWAATFRIIWLASPYRTNEAGPGDSGCRRHVCTAQHWPPLSMLTCDGFIQHGHPTQGWMPRRASFCLWRVAYPTIVP